MIIITNIGEFKVMRPLILKVDEKGKPIVSAEEIQNMVQLAYEEGFKDGSRSNTITTAPINVPQTSPTWPSITWDATTTPLNNQHLNWSSSATVTEPQRQIHYADVACAPKGEFHAG